MKTKCLQCDRTVEIAKIYEDSMGTFALCPECGGSFDVEIDPERFKVLKSGKVVPKYTEKQLARYVRSYARLDGCTHYILREEDGAITQTCDPWINWVDINDYVKSINATLLQTIEP